MSQQHLHRESFRASNPVDDIRDRTKSRVWERTGNVLHTIAVGTGKVLEGGAEFAEGVAVTGGNIAGSLGRMTGTVIGSVADMLRGGVDSFQKAQRKHRKRESE